MKLDSAAVRALNVMPSPVDGGNKSMSVAGLLNKCTTAQGSRLLQQWAKQPLLDINRINERLNVVEAFFADNGLRQSLQVRLRSLLSSVHSVLQMQLKRIPDMHRITKKLQREQGTLDDCVRIYQAINLLLAATDRALSRSLVAAPALWTRSRLLRRASTRDCCTSCSSRRCRRS